MTLPDQNLQDLQARITNINNGYATVYVGGDSSIEIKEKIDRFEDAICAVKSAMEEGVVVGGGNTLWEISKELPNNSIASKAMIQACSSIREQLHANYLGIDNYEYGTLHLPDYFIGYKNGEVCDLTSDIIDPTKVIRLIIENGVSIAGTLITTKCLIINENDYERKF
jgi:chaperonin GroEL